MTKTTPTASKYLTDLIEAVKAWDALREGLDIEGATA